MKILFVCKHNRFRSKVAEALFKKYNKNNNIKVKSAGTCPDFLLVSSNVIKVLREYGIYKINRIPKRINEKLINNSDLIVIVADNINKKDLGDLNDLKDKRIIKWKISDTNQFDYEGILERAKLMNRKVRNLVKSLK